MKYGVKITYSWGDEEDIERYGTFDTEEEAYKMACELAGKEAYVQNEEFLEGWSCVVVFDAFSKSINLNYGRDGEVCYYRIVPTDENGREIEA